VQGRLEDRARWGRYEIVGELGSGGWGEVWAAELVGPAGFRKPVALKVVRERRAGADVVLLDEARLGARLHHPGIVEVYDVGEHEGQLYVAMELVDGCSAAGLSALLGPLPVGAVLDLGVQACAALAYAHALQLHRQPLGLVHQDVKPANILVGRDGRVRLADFGIARARGLTRERPEQVFEGTLGYGAPEQFGAGELDRRADLFSLGVTLVELALGRRLFPCEGAAQYAYVLVDPVGVARESGALDALARVCSGLDGLLAACLEPEPARRPADAAALGRGLKQLAAGAPAGSTLADLVATTADDASPSAPVSLESTLQVVRDNLGPEPDAFVGRERELEELGELLRQGAGLVTLVGPGGTGKTRLALRLTRSLRDSGASELWFCDLSEANDASSVARSVASALRVPLRSGGEAPTETLARALSGWGEALLILDNAEQAIDAVAQAAERWRQVAPRVRLLVTSREPLALAGEQLVRLGSLPEDEAARLFELRAETEAGDVVARLVDRLDRLPLAIELAAGLAAVLPPEALLSRLEAGAQVLRSRRRDRPDRHRSLEATIRWSWELLEPWEQAALARLSVFRGGFTVELAEAVLDLDAWPEAPWTLFVLEALLDKSLLQAEERGEQPRFSLFRSVADWARDQLGDREEVAARRAHVLALAPLGQPEQLRLLRTGESRRFSGRIVAEIPNLEAALRWALGDGPDALVADLACALGTAAALEGPFRPGERGLEAALGRPGVEPEARLRLQLALCTLRLRAGDQAGLEQVSGEALALARAQGARLHEARAAALLASARTFGGAPDEGVALLDRAIDIARELGEACYEAQFLNNLALNEYASGNVQRFGELCADALELGREAADPICEAVSLSHLAEFHVLQGEPERARPLLEQARGLLAELGYRREQALAELNLALIAAPDGCAPDRIEAQRPLLEQAERSLARVGDKALSGMARGYRGLAALRLGQTGAGTELVRQGRAMVAASGSHLMERLLLRDLAVELARQGRDGPAAAALAQAEEAAGPAGGKLFRAELLAVRGYLAGEPEAFDAAALLLEQAGAAPSSRAAARLAEFRARAR